MYSFACGLSYYHTTGCSLSQHSGGAIAAISSPHKTASVPRMTLYLSRICMAECMGPDVKGQGLEGEAEEGGERRAELVRELSRQLSKQLSLEEGDPVSMELDFLQNVYLEELEIRTSR